MKIKIFNKIALLDIFFAFWTLINPLFLYTEIGNLCSVTVAYVMHMVYFTIVIGYFIIRVIPMLKNKQIPSVISLVFIFLAFFGSLHQCYFLTNHSFYYFHMVYTDFLTLGTVNISYFIGTIVMVSGFFVNLISIIVFITRMILNATRQKKGSSAEIFEVNNPNFKQIFKKDPYAIISFCFGLFLIIYACGESFFTSTCHVDIKSYMYLLLFLLIVLVCKNIYEISSFKKRKFSWYLIVSHISEIILSLTMIKLFTYFEDDLIPYKNGYFDNATKQFLYDFNLAYAIMAFLILSIIIAIV